MEKRRPKSRRPRLCAGGKIEQAALEAAAHCPPLRHWVGRDHGAAFDQAQSEILEFLTGAPEVRAWLLQCFSRAGAIVYDKATGKWRGSEVKP